MALITRVARLLRADLHAVLDRLEEPDVVLRQAIREMEDELAEEERRIKETAREHDELLVRETDLAQTLGRLEQELEVCFDSAQDDLARALIRRRLEAQQLQRFLGTRRERLQRALADKKDRLVENRAHLEGLRQKADLLVDEESGTLPEDDWATTGPVVRAEDVEVAFLQEKQKRSRS